MKKLIVALATMAFAGGVWAQGDAAKIDTDFDSLDNNDDQYVSWEEADDNNVSEYFSQIDKDADGRLSAEEFESFTASMPSAVEQGEEIPEPRDEELHVK